MMLRILLQSVILALLPVAAAAQFPTLVADSVSVSADGSTLTATGNVEILSDRRRIRAQGLVFERESDELTVIGPLTVIDEDGSVMVGESAELTPDLQQGIVRGVRILLNENTQIAAAEMHRVDGRYLQFFKAVGSSCNVCEERPVPLWSISAERVIHDAVRKQLYFYDARFEIAGIPIFRIHRLRLPDPTLDRATGFLIPRLKTTTNLGTGIKIPYFVTLGDHADVLLTPYLSSRTNTLEGRVRRELSFGSLQVLGAVTDDDLRSHDVRSYLFADGQFFLPRDFRLNLDLELVSDHAYLWTYGYSNVDRLSSGIEITRSRRDESMSASISMLEGVFGTRKRIGADDKLYLGSAAYQRRIWPDAIGGEVRLAFDAEVSKGPDSTPTGKDRTYRAGVRTDWLNSWVLDRGIVAAVRTQIAADARIDSPDTRPDSPEESRRESESRLIPSAALELRWPHLQIAEGRGTNILEPVVQVAWTDTEPRRYEADDPGGYAEFDEGNLLALSRFQEFDRYERDWRAAAGLGWTHLALDGSEYSITAGRLFRRSREDSFFPGSGLSSEGSDWLLSAQVRKNRLTVSTRSIIDDGTDFLRFEAKFAWKDKLTSASGRYIWASGIPKAPDTEMTDDTDTPDPDIAKDTSEIILEASRVVNRHWALSVDGRYDGSADRTTKAGLGAIYKNECVTVDISVSRRFSTSESTSVPASTDLNIGVELGGFGRNDSGYERSCMVRR